MIKRKLPQVGLREGRRARSSLRACLEQLRHGGPEAVVAALMGQLRKPSGAFGLDEKAADFMIEYTYCVAVRKDPTQEWGAQVYNYVYSDRMLQRGQGARLAPIRRRVWPTGGPGWRLSYRKTAPESEPLNARALQRRLEKQAAYATGPTARRDSVRSREGSQTRGPSCQKPGQGRPPIETGGELSWEQQQPQCF